MRNGWMGVVLAGCPVASPTLVDGFEADLTTFLGCGDLSAYAVDDANTTQVKIQLDEPLAAANGVETHTVLTLPDPTADVIVELGSKISDAACTDLIVDGGPDVRETWTAISGTLTVDLRPDESDARADLVLEDVVFESDSGEQITLGTLSWTDLSVGWLPG